MIDKLWFTSEEKERHIFNIKQKLVYSRYKPPIFIECLMITYCTKVEQTDFSWNTSVLL